MASCFDLLYIYNFGELVSFVCIICVDGGTPAVASSSVEERSRGLESSAINAGNEGLFWRREIGAARVRCFFVSARRGYWARVCPERREASFYTMMRWLFLSLDSGGMMRIAKDYLLELLDFVLFAGNFSKIMYYVILLDSCWSGHVAWFLHCQFGISLVKLYTEMTMEAIVDFGLN